MWHTFKKTSLQAWKSYKHECAASDITSDIFSANSAKRKKSARKCEVVFAYNPMNEDELKLDVGEIIDIVSEVQCPQISAQSQQCCSHLDMCTWIIRFPTLRIGAHY